MLAVEDRVAIYELLSLHGHLMDEGAFDRLTELFTEGFVYDLNAFGYGELTGFDALRESALALGDANPLAHHVTNPLIVDGHGDEARVRSKGFAVLADGSCGSVVYEDLVARTADGWRIACRVVIPRRRPLHGSGSE